MSQQAFQWNRFAITSAGVFLASYVATVLLFGILWDPNGAILLERDFSDVIRIVWTGLYMSIPLAIGSFAVNHPFLLFWELDTWQSPVSGSLEEGIRLVRRYCTF